MEGEMMFEVFVENYEEVLICLLLARNCVIGPISCCCVLLLNIPFSMWRFVIAFKVPSYALKW